MNLVALADENLRLFGEYPYLIFEDSAFTNRQMLHDANALSNGLMGLGIKAGDKAVVMLPNCPEVLVSYQGILRCGAVIVPVISMMTEQELKHILVDCEAVAIITSRDIFQKYEPMLKSIETLKRMIILDDHGDDRTVPDGPLAYRSLLGDRSQSPALPDIREEDLAVILYTAGTTSTPKGVILTHKNLYSNAINAAIAHGTKATDITLVALPLSHSFGITTMNKAYKYGNLHVLMRKFQAGEAFRLIEKYKVTDMPGVPAMFTMMLNSPEAAGHSVLERPFRWPI
jgi:long-chain acyl-CoA synthetase